jgi:hypothetical protein
MYTSPREASRSLRLARLCTSAMLLAALLLVPLAHVPVALAAPAVTVTPTSGLVTTETGDTRPSPSG